MPKYKSLKKRFENPIVHIDRDGNGYCRIREFWAQENIKSYSSLEEFEEHETHERSLTKSEKADWSPFNNKVKKGIWSKEERMQLKKMIKEGCCWDEIAQQLNRSLKGTVRAATIMGLRSEVGA